MLRTAALPDEQRQRLRALVNERGESRVVNELEIPRATLSRILADLPVRPGTRLMVEARLRELDAEAVAHA
jgi:hypothetical protein